MKTGAEKTAWDDEINGVSLLWKESLVYEISQEKAEWTASRAEGELSVRRKRQLKSKFLSNSNE